MRCPYCSYAESKVIDSRDAPEGVRRRRECIQCGLRFTTYEKIQTAVLMVAKRDGRREEYNRDKLRGSIQKACVKRPWPTGSVDKLVEDIETQLHSLGKAETSSAAIGEVVIEKLRSMDPVAYIRFASVYRDFADVESFMEAVEALQSFGKESLGEQGQESSQLPLINDEPRTTGRRRGRKPRLASSMEMDMWGEK